MIFRLKTRHSNEMVRTRFAEYDNGRIALRLLLHDTGEPELTATVNMHEHDLPDGHVFIKTWSENEGVLDALIEAGVIEKPVRMVRAAFAEAAQCPLTPLALEEISNA